MSDIKINAPLPFDNVDAVDEFMTVDAVRDVGRALE